MKYAAYWNRSQPLPDPPKCSLVISRPMVAKFSARLQAMKASWSFRPNGNTPRVPCVLASRSGRCDLSEHEHYNAQLDPCIAIYVNRRKDAPRRGKSTATYLSHHTQRVGCNVNMYRSIMRKVSKASHGRHACIIQSCSTLLLTFSISLSELSRRIYCSHTDETSRGRSAMVAFNPVGAQFLVHFKT